VFENIKGGEVTFDIMIFTYKVRISEPFSFLNLVFSFVVVLAMSETCYLAFVASTLLLVLTKELFSSQLSTFPLTVVIATNDWSELKSPEITSPVPIVLTLKPFSL
jgi:hypothetical protein